MLSTTFSTIVVNATAEIQFRRAVLTLEGVKSDALFAYQPPLNILALLIMLPLKQVLSPRWFHKINVAAVRTLNAPLLLIIGYLERRTLWSGIRRQKETDQLPKSPLPKAGLWDFSRGFSVHGDIQAVFDAEPPQELEDEIEADDDLNIQTMAQAYQQEFGGPSDNTDNKNTDGADDPRPGLTRVQTGKSVRSRRDSVMPFVGLSQHMKDVLFESSDDEENEGGWKKRLEALEKSTGRIEKMLGRLCLELDDKLQRLSMLAGETGTLHDLDKSGTEDLDL